MSDELKRYCMIENLFDGAMYYSQMREGYDGDYYSVDEVDTYIASLQSQIDKLEGKGVEGKLHWYCFSYTGIALSCGGQCDASTYVGYPDKNITISRIDENRVHAGVTKESVLVSATYMGYMTKAEMEGD